MVKSNKNICRKAWICALTAIGLALPAYAESYHSVVISTDDAPIVMLLSSDLQLAFDAEKLTVSDGETSFAIAHESLASISFSTDYPATADDIRQDTSAGKISVSNGMLNFIDGNSHTVSVIDAAGRVLYNSSATNQSINLTDLGSGVVIINIDGNSFKIAI